MELSEKSLDELLIMDVKALLDKMVSYKEIRALVTQAHNEWKADNVGGPGIGRIM